MIVTMIIKSRWYIIKRVDIFNKNDILELELYKLYNRSDISDNTIKRDKIKLIIADIMTHELTNKQYKCVYMYFVENIKQKEIAKRLNVNQSTVSRNIKRGLTRIKKYTKYLKIR